MTLKLSQRLWSFGVVVDVDATLQSSLEKKRKKQPCQPPTYLPSCISPLFHTTASLCFIMPRSCSLSLSFWGQGSFVAMAWVKPPEVWKSLLLFVASRRGLVNVNVFTSHFWKREHGIAAIQPASINRPNKNAKNGKLNLTVSFSWMRLGCWWWWRWRLKLCSFCKSRDPRSMNFFYASLCWLLHSGLDGSVLSL